jgi:hypothetical protein
MNKIILGLIALMISTTLVSADGTEYNTKSIDSCNTVTIPQIIAAIYEWSIDEEPIGYVVDMMNCWRTSATKPAVGTEIFVIQQNATENTTTTTAYSTTTSTTIPGKQTDETKTTAIATTTTSIKSDEMASSTTPAEETTTSTSAPTTTEPSANILTAPEFGSAGIIAAILMITPAFSYLIVKKREDQ